MKRILIQSYLDMNFGDSLLLESVMNYCSRDELYVIGENPFTYQWIQEQYAGVNIIQQKDITDSFLDSITDFIKVGGSVFQHNTWYEGVLRYRQAQELSRYKKHGIRIHIVDCNIGPIRTNIGVGSTKRILRLADTISCRDTESYKLIKKWSKRAQSQMCMDLVFAQEFPKTTQHNEYTIGISVYTAYIPSLINKNLSYCNQICNILESYNKKQRFIVKLFVFDTFRNNDFPNAYKIKKWCEDNGIQCEMVSYDGNSRKMMEAMRSCNFVIGTRFHSIIISMKMGIPCLPIVYSSKTDNMLNLVGYRGKRIRFGDDFSDIETDKLCFIDISSETSERLSMDAKKHLNFLNEE